MSTDLTLSKAQSSKLIQSGGVLGSLLSKLACPLMKVAVPLAKNMLALNNSSCFSDWCRKSKENTRFWSSFVHNFNNFKQRNEWNNWIVQALEDSIILLKGVTKTIKNETKEQKGGFLSMLLGTLGASLLGNILAGKGIVRAGSGNKKGKGIVRAGTGKQWDF